MSDYSFEVEFLRQSGDVLARAAVEPDWTRALECIHFKGAREGRVPALTSAPAAEGLQISPTWKAQLGAPHLESVRLTLTCADGTIGGEIPRSYFASLARDASGALVDQGLLEAGETFQYRVCATPAPLRPKAAAEASLFEVEDVVQHLTLTKRSLPEVLATAAITDADLDDGDMPLLISPDVLDGARAQARAAGDIETGGVLIGHLYRDVATPEICARITAQIPAVHTESQTTKLTFTADTWAAARAALDLRRRGEQFLGFWHSHPDWCRLRGCPREQRVGCSAALPFLSTEDVHLFGTCFGHAYHVTLLVSDHTARGWTCAMYGWRDGVVARRAFHVTGESPVG